MRKEEAHLIDDGFAWVEFLGKNTPSMLHPQCGSEEMHRPKP